MIVYSEKGYQLHNYISNQGHQLWNEDGVWKSSDDAAVQILIDNFDALTEAKSNAYLLIDKASGEARLRYAPDLLLAEEYRIVKEQALLFIADASIIGQALQSAADYDNLTVTQAANLVIAKSNALTSMLEAVRAIRLTAKANIRDTIDWTLCKSIADIAVAQLEAI